MKQVDSHSVLALISGVIVLGAIAVLRGQDASYDLQLYHFYNGWAHATDRASLDLAVAGLQTYLNPTVDVLSWWLIERLPARGVGFVLGAVHGVTFWLVFLIARSLSPFEPGRTRTLVALLCATLGVLGAVGLCEVGTVQHDLTTGVFVIAALAIVQRADGRIAWLLGAGVVLGVGVGMKSTLGVYVVGLCAALAAHRRLRDAIAVGAASVGGFLMINGGVMLALYRQFGNPLFPFYNAVFRSPWFEPINVHTGISYVPKTLLDALVLPFRWCLTTTFAMQRPFRDLRLPVIFALALVVLVVWLVRRKRPETKASWLLLFFFVSFAAWAKAFAIYRYLAPLEALAPTLIVSMLALVLPDAKRLLTTIGVVFALLAVTLVPADYGRVAWGDRFLEVSAPRLERPSDAIVLVASRQPISYVIPAFPPQARFIGAANNMIGPRSERFHAEIADITRTEGKDFYLLAHAMEKQWAMTSLARFSLVVRRDACDPVRAAFGDEILLCRVERATTALPVVTVSALRMCPTTKTGTATLTWKVPGATQITVRVGSPTGRVLVTGTADGTHELGAWAKKGTKLFVFRDSAQNADDAAAVVSIDEIEEDESACN